MMYTISWFDDRGVLFRVSFQCKKDAQSYFDEIKDVIERSKSPEYFQELKFYEEK